MRFDLKNGALSRNDFRIETRRRSIDTRSLARSFPSLETIYELPATGIPNKVMETFSPSRTVSNRLRLPKATCSRHPNGKLTDGHRRRVRHGHHTAGAELRSDLVQSCAIASVYLDDPLHCSLGEKSLLAIRDSITAKKSCHQHGLSLCCNKISFQ